MFVALVLAKLDSEVIGYPPDVYLGRFPVPAVPLGRDCAEHNNALALGQHCVDVDLEGAPDSSIVRTKKATTSSWPL